MTVCLSVAPRVL